MEQRTFLVAARLTLILVAASLVSASSKAIRDDFFQGSGRLQALEREAIAQGETLRSNQRLLASVAAQEAEMVKKSNELRSRLRRLAAGIPPGTGIDRGTVPPRPGDGGREGGSVRGAKPPRIGVGGGGRGGVNASSGGAGGAGAGGGVALPQPSKGEGEGEQSQGELAPDVGLAVAAGAAGGGAEGRAAGASEVARVAGSHELDRLQTPLWVRDFSSYMLAESLAALTGLKAFIPLLVIAVGARFVEDFPFDLRKEFEWLKEWPAILVLTLFCLAEIVFDAVPTMDEFLDKIMIPVKPTLATFIIFAHEPQGSAGLILWMGVWGCLDAASVALAKQAFTTLTLVASDDGSATVVRSVTEDLIVALLSTLSVHFSSVAPSLVVSLSVAMVCLFCGVRSVRRFYAMDQLTSSKDFEADAAAAAASPRNSARAGTVQARMGHSPRSTRSPRSRSPRSRSPHTKLTPRLLNR